MQPPMQHQQQQNLRVNSNQPLPPPTTPPHHTTQQQHGQMNNNNNVNAYQPQQGQYQQSNVAPQGNYMTYAPNQQVPYMTQQQLWYFFSEANAQNAVIVYNQNPHLYHYLYVQYQQMIGQQQQYMQYQQHQFNQQQNPQSSDSTASPATTATPMPTYTPPPQQIRQPAEAPSNPYSSTVTNGEAVKANITAKPTPSPSQAPYSNPYAGTTPNYTPEYTPTQRPPIVRPVRKVLEIINPKTKEKIQPTVKPTATSETASKISDEIREKAEVQEQKKPEPVVEEPKEEKKQQPVEEVKPIEPVAPKVTPPTTATTTGSSSVADEMYKQVFLKLHEGKSSTPAPAKPVETTPKPVESAPKLVEETKEEEVKSESAVEPVAAPVKMSDVVKAPPKPTPGKKRDANGKFTYTLAEMQKLKDLCRERPASLEPSEIDLELIPANMNRSGVGGRSFAGAGNKGSRFGAMNRQAPAASKPPQWSRGNKPVTTIPAANLPQLATSENAWRPSEAKDETEKAIKEATSLLNKISREFFDKISDKLYNLPMPTYAALHDFVKLIQDKALTEPKFADMYADLCYVMEHGSLFSNTQTNKKKKAAEQTSRYAFLRIVTINNNLYWTKETLPDEEIAKLEGLSEEEIKEKDLVEGPFPTKAIAEASAGKSISFRRLLLTLSQEEFEDERTKQEMENQLQEMIAKRDAEGTSTEEKNKLIMEVQEHQYKISRARQRMFGNMIFIGELYKKDMINVKVLLFCIMSLAGRNNPNSQSSDVDEEKIECCCKIISTVGKRLEQQTKDDTIIQQLIEMMENFTRDERLDSRHRFLCKDVVELHQNNWVPRRGEVKAKTLKEVHADVKREEEEAARKARQLAEQQSNRRGFNSIGRDNRSSNSRVGSSFGSVVSASGNNSRTVGGSSKFTSTSTLKRPTVSLKSTASATPLKNTDVKDVRKRVKDMLEEYANIRVAAELEARVKSLEDEFEKDTISQGISEEAVTRYLESSENEKGNAVRESVPKAISICIKETGINPNAVVNALIKTAEVLDDIKMDTPKAEAYFIRLLGHLVLLNVLDESVVESKVVSAIEGVESSVVMKKVKEAVEDLKSKEQE